MEVQIQTWRRVLLFMYANSSSGGVLPPLSYSYPQRNQTFSSHTRRKKKLFQSHQSEKLSNIILFIQDNFILLSMHKMLEKKMQTFTHSRWMDTPFFHLQIFRKFLSNPIRLQETATISTHDLFKKP